MKKNNTQAVVLCASLSLSMVLGLGFHPNLVSAAEQIEEPTQENTSSEMKSEGETLENIEEQETDSEETSRNSETLPKDKLEDLEDSENSEDLEDSENLNNKPSAVEENEDSDVFDEEDSEEEILEDEVVDSEDDNTSSEDKTVEREVDEVAEKEEISESNDERLEKDIASEKETMTMSASSGNSNETVRVDRLHGQNRFSNAVEISKRGWSSAPKVFLANGDKFADSLTGSPLAALNNAPILLTRENSLPDVTLAELKRLNTREIVILGGELSISKNIADYLKKNGFIVTRIGGNNRYTQAELVANEIKKQEGKNRDAFLTSGEVFSDALSIATIASGKRLPIYLTRGNRLEQSVINAIPNVNSWTIIGGELSINKAVENEMKNKGAKVKRISGRDRYEVNRNVLNYYGTPKEHLYVTSGEHYSDTLPASVLAAKEKSGVLLVRNNRKITNDEQKVFAQNKHKIRNFTIIGGPLTLSEQTKKDFETLITTVNSEILEIIKKQFPGFTFSHYNIRLDEALNMQMLVNPQTDKRYTAFISKEFVDSRTNKVTADILNVRSGAGSNNHIITQLKKGDKVNIINETNNWYQIDLRQMWLNASQNDVKYYLNPNNFILSEKQIFQFLDLSKTSGATAAELNTFLKGKGILEGMGQAFIDASKKHGVNEIYLLSHALLETGNGTSKLATGVKINGDEVYNMFGIGAIDSDPVGKGSQRAYQEGWFTPGQAIIGGAAFIGNNYVKSGQNTLYKMRWNPETMDNHGYASHQYATDIGWSFKQVNTMYNLYNSIGVTLKFVDIPVFLA